MLPIEHFGFRKCFFLKGLFNYCRVEIDRQAFNRIFHQNVPPFTRHRRQTYKCTKSGRFSDNLIRRFRKKQTVFLRKGAFFVLSNVALTAPKARLCRRNGKSSNGSARAAVVRKQRGIDGINLKILKRFSRRDPRINNE